MDNTAKRLDEFFALENSDEHENARAEGRVRFGWEPRTRDLAAQDFRFRVRVKLPALKNRVDLMLSDDESYDREDSIRAARDAVNENRDSTTLSLRYQKEQSSPLSYRIGAGRRDQLFVKGQYEDTLALSAPLSLRYDGELYYYTRDQLGAELGLNFSYQLADEKYLRFHNRYYYRDRFEDWLWRHEFQYLRPLTDQSAVLYTFVTKGTTEPNHQLTEVYTSARWRTQYKRQWLFFELEPFVIWLRNEDFKASYGLAMRFEFYYGQT
ncbi:hypothetical protein [Alteromonas lipolytica]|uniref:Uncharacterized protein n=1 Tax=Alteromonas lipolytica TaxID=1856405 RepID=A0A1E8F913_9ALTE|nr:hypothetical protein [Alteromonas lipolytica]OFI32405.1 hypothetical protein BFC17_06730 [Alteromonas lipolytica]GGF79954.1 hypothetical protein GCM10011338_35380 [Alteromonas lipolytica]